MTEGYKGYASVADYINAAPNNDEREKRKAETFGIRYGIGRQAFGGTLLAHQQQISRALRAVDPNVKPIVVDYAAIEKRAFAHALVERKDNMAAHAKRGVPLKHCHACGEQNFLATRICTACYAVFPRKGNR